MTAPPAQDRYTQAAETAAALYAASKLKPDPTAVIARNVLSSAAMQTTTTTTTTAIIIGLWRRTNPYDDKAVAEFAAQAGQVMVPAQQTVARIAAAERTQQLRAAGVNITVNPRVPDDVRSAAPDGSLVRRARVTVDYAGGHATVTQRSSDTARVFTRVADTYRYNQSEGRAHVDVQAAAEQRIESIVDGNMQVTRRMVEHQAMTQAVDLDRQIIGYRRIIHPELSKGGVCGMCVVAADRIYKVGELKAIHHLCKCTVLEVFEDYDPGHDLNQRDIEALYKSAQGNTNQLLKRTRYRVVEHSELGPMLVPRKGSPVPYFQVPVDQGALVAA